MIGVRHHQRAGLFKAPERRRFFIDAIAGVLGTTLGIGSTAATIGAGALEGAAVGAGTSALTGGNALTGALTGGLTGGATAGLSGPLADATGISTGQAGALVGAATGAAGNAATGGNPLTGAITGGIGGYAMGSSLGEPGQTGSAANANMIGENGAYIVPPVPPDQAATQSYGYDTAGNPVSSDTNAVSQQGASSASGNGTTKAGGIFGGGGGINGTSAALGLLAALGSSQAKPAVGTWSTPSPSSVQQGAYYNTPLNTSVPGRTAVNPGLPTANSSSGAPPNYWTYGGPEQTYFTGNSLQNFGFSRGGALGRDWQVEKDGRHVRGPGSGISDSIPAQLSKGEYILTARDVARVGGGSNERGARILDRDRKALAKKVHEPQFTAQTNGALGSVTRRARA